MRFDFTEEQEALRDSVRQFLAARAPVERLRHRAEHPGTDLPVWRGLAEELGLHALLAPEGSGGYGAGWVEAGGVAEIAGAALLPGPYVATSVAVAALSGSQQHRQVVDDLVSGSRLAALTAPGSSGEVSPVPGAAEADVLLCLRPGAAAAMVDLADNRVRREPAPSLDFSNAAADVAFADDVTQVLDVAAEPLLAAARALRAAELVGVAQRSLDLTVAYVGEREQFGRPVGTFQAVQHRLADAYVILEEARSTAYYALWACATGDRQQAVWAALALTTALDASQQVTGDAIQLHGGIGFTWEHDAHLYYRRAYDAPGWLGSASQLRAELARAAAPDGRAQPEEKP